MTKPILAAAAAAFLLALPAAALAQDTPEQVADRYLQTLKAQDWAGNAALVDAPELDSLKAAFIDAATADTSTAGLRQYFNLASPAQLQALPASQVYQRFVASTITQNPGMVQFLTSATFRVLGHVAEGDTAHVVYRVSAGGQMAAQGSQVSVLSVVRYGGAWKVPLNEQLRGAIAELHANAAQARAARSARATIGAPPAGPTRPAAPPAAAPPTRP